MERNSESGTESLQSVLPGKLRSWRTDSWTTITRCVVVPTEQRPAMHSLALAHLLTLLEMFALTATAVSKSSTNQERRRPGKCARRNIARGTDGRSVLLSTIPQNAGCRVTENALRPFYSKLHTDAHRYKNALAPFVFAALVGARIHSSPFISSHSSTMVFGRKKAQNAQPVPPPPPGPSQTPAQTARAMARQNDRTIQRAQRDMQRERLQLEQKERQLEVEIKKLGRQGRLAEARILAKNLVQVRNAKTRTFQAGVHAGAIATQAKMAATEAKMMEVIGNTTQVMQNANGMSDTGRYMNMLQQYDMQSEKYKLNQEMTDEVLDSVLGGEDIGAESDDVLNSVLDEIGLEVSSKVGGSAAIAPQAVPQQPALQQADAALMARIERLGN
eukprot:TRINITY_DN929_c0_g1_i1.p1 TRINITY_DN929_c0_g1~~TRINITY_DN929_c0_g1_i1.p1  ORF type:complete len:388 (-),score=67.97 TRINITY_DN929_c0_g1_i1:616-1779(-)